MSGCRGRFAGKGAIVTGAARGIGLGCARRLAADGARVLLLDIAEDAGETAAEALREAGYDARFLRCDSAVIDDLRSAVAFAVEAGGIDIAVCAAGIGGPAKDFVECDIADFDRVHAVNLRGPLLLGQMVARHMIESGRKGTIIYISSVNAEMAIGDRTDYCVSKAGLAMLAKVMAVSLGPHGIRVNAVGPGPIRTEMAAAFVASPGAMDALLLRTPLGRIGEVEEIAGTVAFLASDDAGFITGQSIYPDGGRLALSHVMSPAIHG